MRILTRVVLVVTVVTWSLIAGAYFARHQGPVACFVPEPTEELFPDVR